MEILRNTQVPYPLTSHSRDLKAGSKQVKIGGQPVALQGQSYYQTNPLGNEAATRNFGASIVSHETAGKTQFSAGSIDVKFEGMKVCRHSISRPRTTAASPARGSRRAPTARNLPPRASWGSSRSIPKGVVSAECLALHNAQTKLQGYISYLKP
jgi:hypothetical protein